MKKINLLFCFVLFLPLFSYAQRECGTMDRLEELQQLDPDLEERMQEIERFTKDFLNNPQAELRAGELLTIPVVFHVLYNGDAENISDAQLQRQLDVLNEDFRRTNSDADNTWSQAADTEIEFCLASIDPDGNPTSGIERKSTNKRSWRTNDDMKKSNKGGLNAWDASSYLNIWVCDISNGILGYAQFPGGNPATDGIVLDYAYTGRGGSAQAPFDLGRTGTHEVGHWLNLRHIWGDGGCSVDDFVGDTPVSDGPNYGCALGHVSCSTTDMVQNYMDYSDDDCMNLYTADQRDRMQALFAPNSPYDLRASLLNSNGCGGGSTPTCNDGVQNGDETGVDCGGPCGPCNTASCTDNIQNGEETGVDCGGSCPPCNIGSCDVPDGLVASNIKPKRAKLNWSVVAGAVSYDVQLRVQEEGSSWQNASTSNTNIQASGLSNGATYEWRVATNCGGSTSDYSAICSFTAGNSGSGACGNGRLDGSSHNISLYPNPVRDYLNVEMSFTDLSTIQLMIVDIYGKTLQVEEVAGNIPVIQMNISDYPSGIYFLTAKTKDGFQQTERFVVNR